MDDDGVEERDPIEDALVLLVTTLEQIKRLPLIERAPAAARFFRAMKYLSDQARELRNVSIFHYAVAAADERRRTYNEAMEAYPETYTGDWLDEEQEYSFERDGKIITGSSLQVQNAFRRHAKFTVDWKLGPLRFRIPVPPDTPEATNGWLSLDAFSNESEPFRIAERERFRRAGWRQQRRLREERAAEREAKKRARDRALTEGDKQ